MRSPFDQPSPLFVLDSCVLIRLDERRLRPLINIALIPTMVKFELGSKPGREGVLSFLSRCPRVRQLAMDGRIVPFGDDESIEHVVESKERVRAVGNDEAILDACRMCRRQPVVLVTDDVNLRLNDRVFNVVEGVAGRSVALLDWACPGALPVLNKDAVHKAAKAAVLLNCKPADCLLFDRKHYKHHDLPLGYQITQKRAPLAVEGLLKAGHDSPIQRIQLEQDTGKTVHQAVDLCRAGNALIEIVTAPIFHTVKAAQDFCLHLVRVLTDAGVTEGRLEAGQVRFDVNISSDMGRVEVKNLNSFKYIQVAVEQLTPEHSGKTLGFDQKSRTVFEMRDKASYFYLPEPDIPATPLDKNVLLKVRSELEPTRFELLEGLGYHESQTQRLLSVALEQFKLWRRILQTSGDPSFAFTWAILEANSSTKYDDLETIVGAVHRGEVSRRQARLLIQQSRGGQQVAIPEPRSMRRMGSMRSMDDLISECCPVDAKQAQNAISEAIDSTNKQK